MKKIKYLCVFIFCFILLIFVGSCGSNETYKLNFIVDSEIYSTVEITDVSSIKMPEEPQKENYKFEGWYWDKDIWKEKFTIKSLSDAALSDNMNVYAHFIDDSSLKGTDIEIERSIKKNVEGLGEAFLLKFNNSQIVCKFNDYVKVNPSTKWQISTDIEGNNTITSKTVEMSVGDSPIYYIYVTDRNDNHELYFVLLHRNYIFNIEFDSKGGTVCNSVKVEEDNYLEDIPSPTKEGYTFSGWDYDFENKPIKGNVVANAIWIQNSNTITFDSNGGELSVKSMNVQYDSQYHLPTPTKRGYEFKGWFLGDNIITDGIWKRKEDISLKAEWEIANYNLIYELNGGINNENNPICYNTNMQNLRLYDPIKEGYTFLGWEYNGNVIDEIDTTIACHMELKALWTYYTLTTNVNNEKAGIISSYDNVKITKGKEITITAKANAGYTFEGWYNGNKELTKELSYTFNMPTENLVYTAKLTANATTVYKVEHYLQNIEDDSYPELPYETVNLTGTTDTLTNGSVNNYEGFVSPSITQVNINGDGSTIIKLNYKRNTYTISLGKNIGKAGTVTGEGTYKYGESIVITATTNPGYTFNGWYFNKLLYKGDDSFTYTIGTSSIEFEATYIANKYTITLDNQVEGVDVLGITSGNEYEFDTQITLIAKNNGDSLFVWKVNGKIVYVGNEYSFNVPSYDVNITTTTSTNGVYTRNGNKIYFGTYPQTKVEATTENGLTSITFDSFTWTSYRYYIESVQSDFMYYKDVDIDNNGTYDYRGVYFTNYRYYDTTSSSAWSDNHNGYNINTIYWFSYDPIEWDILSESNGKALIIANLIIDSQEYYSSWQNGKFEHNDGIGYSNDYSLSNIRKWLNDTFYNTAFDVLQKELIEITTVDNSLSSTNYEATDYICDNTNDKLYLLSCNEVSIYYPSKNERVTSNTDYSKCQSTEKYSEYEWRLRSPSNYSSGVASTIHQDGSFGNIRGVTEIFGIRPVCQINILGNL